MRNACPTATLALLLAACTDRSDTAVACTTNVVFGVDVHVLDAVDRRSLGGASLTLLDGNYLETMQELDPVFAPGRYAGAAERAGTYRLEVELNGYLSQVIEGIEVTADLCHVIPVTVEVELQPGPMLAHAAVELRDADTGEPVAGAFVEIAGPDGREPLVEFEPDELPGVYAHRADPQASLLLVAAPGFESVAVPLGDGARDLATVELRRVR